MRQFALVGWIAILWVVGARADDAILPGNPLQSVPLSALKATRERPLFSTSRRAPEAPVAIAPQASPPPPALPPPQPEAPPFRLVGTIVGAGAHVALLLNRSTNEVTSLREGDSQQGWQARKVLARSILLQRGAEYATLDLPKANDANGANAASAAPADPASPDIAAPPVAAFAAGPPLRRAQR